MKYSLLQGILSVTTMAHINRWKVGLETQISFDFFRVAIANQKKGNLIEENLVNKDEV